MVLSAPHWSAPIVRTGLVLVAAVLVGVLSIVGAAIHPAIGFAVIVGGIAAFVLLTRPTAGFAAFAMTVTILPFGVVPVPIGGVRLTFIDAIITSLLFILIAQLLTRRRERLVLSPVGAPILVFLGLALVSFIIGVQSTTAELTRFFLKTLNGIVFYFSVVNLISSRDQQRVIVRAIIVGSAIGSGIAVLFYFLDQTLVLRILSGLRSIGYYPSGATVVRTIAESQTLRAIGTAVDPNVLAGLLLLTVPFTVTQLFTDRPVFSRVVLVSALAVMLLCLILTFSRSSWVGAVGATLLLATLRYRRVWLLLILIGALIALLPAGDLVAERFQSGLQFEDRAAQMRLGEYKDALRLIAAYPWFGVGFGAAPDIELYIAASSIYLLIAEEMGLIGLTAFLIVIVTFFVTGIAAWRRSRHGADEPVLLGALAAITGALVAGIFDHYFFNLYFPQTVSLFWLVMGIAQVAPQGQGDDDYEMRPTKNG